MGLQGFLVMGAARAHCSPRVRKGAACFFTFAFVISMSSAFAVVLLFCFCGFGTTEEKSSLFVWCGGPANTLV